MCTRLRIEFLLIYYYTLLSSGVKIKTFVRELLLLRTANFEISCASNINLKKVLNPFYETDAFFTSLSRIKVNGINLTAHACAPGIGSDMLESEYIYLRIDECCKCAQD